MRLLMSSDGFYAIAFIYFTCILALWMARYTQNAFIITMNIQYSIRIIQLNANSLSLYKIYIQNRWDDKGCNGAAMNGISLFVQSLAHLWGKCSTTIWWLRLPLRYQL